MPGSWKTILASLVIDTFWLARDPAGPENIGSLDIWLDRSREKEKLLAGIAGVYCSYKTAETVVAILGSVVKQLAEPIVDLPGSVIDASTKPE